MASIYRKLGQLAGPKWRKASWLWRSATGGEREILDAEFQVGRDLNDALREQFGVDPDLTIRESIQGIGHALAACVKNPHRRFAFTVAGGGEPNAFALPGGFIFIARSLIDIIGRDQDAIAFVLGHEMGHVIKQHSAGRVFSDAALGVAANAIPVARGVAGRWVKSSAVRLLQSAYSQDNELLADRFGFRLAMAAGFDSEGGPRLLQCLSKLNPSDNDTPLAEYFTSHPPFDLRISELRKYQKEVAKA